MDSPSASESLFDSPVTRELLFEEIDILQQRIKVLQLELSTYKARVQVLQEENRTWRLGGPVHSLSNEMYIKLDQLRHDWIKLEQKYKKLSADKLIEQNFEKLCQSSSLVVDTVGTNWNNCISCGEIVRCQACERFATPATIDSNISIRESQNINSEDRQSLIYPPPYEAPGGIPINTKDFECLSIDQQLNGAIIDFYLTHLQKEIITDDQRKRTFIFSQLFYKRLMATIGQTQNDIKHTTSEQRHSQVTKWTKNVNIFCKDYIMIPINEKQHWFLAIICFPGLSEPVTYDYLKVTEVEKNVLDRRVPDKSAIYEIDSFFEPCDDVDLTLQNIKQPCILIFDSFNSTGFGGRSVVPILYDYLTCEYRTKYGKSNSRVFDKDNMPCYEVKVPQQSNSTDCGLYLLQYVEQFFKDPIKDYRLPAINKQLSNWFDGMIVTSKRENISNLLTKLVDRHSPDILHLPDITRPTLNGELLNYEHFKKRNLKKRKIGDDDELEDVLEDKKELQQVELYDD